MYKITFDQVDEIRMGSPYNTARIHVEGGYFPHAAQGSFQDKCVVTEDGQTCFVIAWETEQNQPAFRVWRVSNAQKNVMKSEKIPGCCTEIRYLPEEDEVSVKVFEYPQGIRIEKIKI